MSRTLSTVAALTCSVVAAPVLGGGWVTFNNETTLRLPTGPEQNDSALSTSDTEEKDYAWGDVDNDGDIDLVCVRKQEFTSTGKRVNVLFMNEGIAEGHAVNGVFIDHTADYVTDVLDVGGDDGFNTPTNDRDVVLVDVDNDGWLDMVTATTLTDNQAKHLSHPRVYMNMGESGGNWQGFRFEDFRIPEMHPTAGPRFCSVAAADVTGDGYADLYFGDYDSGGAQIFDYNNKLLINSGVANPGVFLDESDGRLTSDMRLSAFGAATVMADVNQDGAIDVVKQTSLNAPTHVAVTYNNAANQGFFNDYHTIYGISPYFVSMGDLNNDGLLDIVITDDGTDRYMLNTGVGGNGGTGVGRVGWTEATFPSGASGGFGGNSIVADLNNDGFQDVLITDVDVDISGCSRRMHVYRNLGNLPTPSFQEQGEVIPNSLLAGTHDVAVFDINEDGWLDLIVGRCSTTEIWINQPPTGLVYAYPDGLPSFVEPDAPKSFQVALSVIGSGSVVGGTAQQHVSINGGGFTTSPMTLVSGTTYMATLPPVACTDQLSFYFSADLDTGGTFTDPAGAPVATYSAISADGTNIAFRDEFEKSAAGWTVESTNLDSGGWEVADPNGTIDGGNLAAPEDDATQGAENTMAFVTENGTAGGSAVTNDIDGGPTYLISPSFDLDGTDATITFARWFYSSTSDDQMTVDVSNGGAWISVSELTTGGTNGSWETVSFVVSDYVAPSGTVQVRFGAADQPNNSVAEAGVDNFQVEDFVCNDACAGDLNGDGSVAFADLTQLLGAWGDCPGCAADLDGDGAVAFADLTQLLGSWGPCP